jgi:hypothetical protein
LNITVRWSALRSNLLASGVAHTQFFRPRAALVSERSRCRTRRGAVVAADAGLGVLHDAGKADRTVIGLRLD